MSGNPDEHFLKDVVDGLTAEPRRLPSKYFYDRRGSELFEQITDLDEYYLTRTELAIMQRYAEEMADVIGEKVLLIEPGSGASVKVRLLLKHLHRPAAYVPVDISREHMASYAAELAREFPALPVRPVHADFCLPFTVPRADEAVRRVVYFPGSTIGNFEHADVVPWLRNMADVAQEGGGLLIGADLKKDTAIIEAAYNDRAGVTRDFNLNLLHRIRDELDADLDVDGFDHQAFYNDTHGRIEMHLVANRPQTVSLDHTTVDFAPGDTIHTENSYKYDLDQLHDLAAKAGWRRVAVWTDDDRLFSVQYFETA